MISNHLNLVLPSRSCLCVIIKHKASSSLASLSQQQSAHDESHSMHPSLPETLGRLHDVIPLLDGAFRVESFSPPKKIQNRNPVDFTSILPLVATDCCFWGLKEGVQGHLSLGRSLLAVASFPAGFRATHGVNAGPREHVWLFQTSRNRSSSGLK